MCFLLSFLSVSLYLHHSVSCPPSVYVYIASFFPLFSLLLFCPLNTSFTFLSPDYSSSLSFSCTFPFSLLLTVVPSLSFSLSLSLSFPLSLSLCLCLWLSLSLYIYIYLPLYLFFHIYIIVPLSLSITIYIFHCLWLTPFCRYGVFPSKPQINFHSRLALSLTFCFFSPATLAPPHTRSITYFLYSYVSDSGTRRSLPSAHTRTLTPTCALLSSPITSPVSR